MAVDDLRWSDGRSLQVSAWRGRHEVAVISPAPGRPTPTADAVRSTADRLAAQGVQRLLTGALHPIEVPAFTDAGFAPHDHLHLLRHDLVGLPEATVPVRIRRAHRRDRAAVLELDERAFDEFWTLDARGLADAVRATPTSRYRVATHGRGPVAGYAVTGLASDRGYLQRLAVDPSEHRRGVGMALVADALRWLVRRGARSAVVNTQDGNAAALALYTRCGFVLEPHGLTVLARDLAAAR